MTEPKLTGVFFGETNQGIVRTNNEDSYICKKIWDENHILCAAIDGLGGYEGGEIAAELARATIIRHLEDFASKKTVDLLRDALIDANNEIIRQHKARPKVSQMGCVASVGLIDLTSGIISIAHVGDSRIYQFTNGELKKLTHDHSLVGYREETGEMSEEDAMHHPKRNVIDKYLGEQHLNFDSDSYIEISVWPITGDTQYLFCSDGLTDLVRSNQIVEVLSSGLSISNKVNRLITCANEAGGKDNITVVIAEITYAKDFIGQVNNEDETSMPQKPNHIFNHSSKFRSIVHILLGISIGIATALVYFHFNPLNKFENPSSELQLINEQLTFRVKELEDSINRISKEHIDDSIKRNGNDSLQACKPLNEITTDTERHKTHE